ncbi:regulator of chromatin [Anaeramoeba flamelloides]|uniref:Regulator of chromatin n=1 Tax=Anaeramoeba flamelloides TaxID=1746091 RepID=A0ABQ8XJX5_9EUKA|nr:regulator of chromatin [Anaeramoeba flamelloides]
MTTPFVKYAKRKERKLTPTKNRRSKTLKVGQLMQSNTLPCLLTPNKPYSRIEEDKRFTPTASALRLRKSLTVTGSRSQQNLNILHSLTTTVTPTKTKTNLKAKNNSVLNINETYQQSLVDVSSSKKAKPQIQTVSITRSRVWTGGDGFSSEKKPKSTNKRYNKKKIKRNSISFFNQNKQNDYNHRKRVLIEPALSLYQKSAFKKKKFQNKNKKTQKSSHRSHKHLLSNLLPKKNKLVLELQDHQTNVISTRKHINKLLEDSKQLVSTKNIDPIIFSLQLEERSNLQTKRRKKTKKQSKRQFHDQLQLQQKAQKKYANRKKIKKNRLGSKLFFYNNKETKDVIETIKNNSNPQSKKLEVKQNYNKKVGLYFNKQKSVHDKVIFELKKNKKKQKKKLIRKSKKPINNYHTKKNLNKVSQLKKKGNPRRGGLKGEETGKELVDKNEEKEKVKEDEKEKVKEEEEEEKEKEIEKDPNQRIIEKHLPHLFNENIQLRLTEQYNRSDISIEIEFKLFDSTHFYVTKPDILEVCKVYQQIDKWQFNEKIQTFVFPLEMHYNVIEKLNNLKHFNVLLYELPKWILICLNGSTNIGSDHINNDNNTMDRYGDGDGDGHNKTLQIRIKSINANNNNFSDLKNNKSPSKVGRGIDYFRKDIIEHSKKYKGRIMLTDNQIFGKCVSSKTRIITKNFGILLIKDIFKRFADKKSKKIEIGKNVGEWYDFNQKFLSVYSVNPNFEINKKATNCNLKSTLKIVKVGKIYRERVSMLIKFTTANGMRHLVAPNHKLFTLQDGWVPAHKLDLNRHALIFSSPIDLCNSINFYNKQLAKKFGKLFSSLKKIQKKRERYTEGSQIGKKIVEEKNDQLFLLNLTKIKNVENLLNQLNVFSIKYKVIERGKSKIKIGIHLNKSFHNILNFIENWPIKMIKIFLKSFFYKKSLFSIPLYNKRIASSLCYQISKFPNKIGKIHMIKNKKLKAYQIKIENTFNKYFSLMNIIRIKQKKIMNKNKKWVYDLSITEKDDPKTYLFNCLLGHNTIQGLSLASYYQMNWPLLIICKRYLRRNWFEKCKMLLDLQQNEKIKLFTSSSSSSSETSSSSLSSSFSPQPLSLSNSNNAYNYKTKKRKKNKKQNYEQNLITIMSYKDFEENIEINEKLNDKYFGVAILDTSYQLNEINSIQFQRIKKLLKNTQQLIILNQMFNRNKPLNFFPQLQLLQPKIFKSKKKFAKRYQLESSRCNNQNELLMLLEKIGVKINNNNNNSNDNNNDDDDDDNDNNNDNDNKNNNNKSKIRKEGGKVPKREQIIFECGNDQNMKKILNNYFLHYKKIKKIQNSQKKKKNFKKQQKQNLKKLKKRNKKYYNDLYNLSILNKKKNIILYILEVISSISLSSENNLKKLIIFAENEKMIDEIANRIHEKQFEFIKIVPNLDENFINLLINKFKSQNGSCNIALISLKTDCYQKIVFNHPSLIIFSEMPYNLNLLIQIEKEILKSISFHNHQIYIQYLLCRNSIDVLNLNYFYKKMKKIGINFKNNYLSILFNSAQNFNLNYDIDFDSGSGSGSGSDPDSSCGSGSDLGLNTFSNNKSKKRHKSRKANYNGSEKISKRSSKKNNSLNSVENENQQVLKLFLKRDGWVPKTQRGAEIEIDLDEEDSQSDSDSEN